MLPKNCQTKASAFVQSHKCELITWFQSDSSYILQKAHSKDLLTQLEYQRIKSTQDPAERVTELLDIMLGRGEQTCQKFRNMLTEVQDTYPQLGDLLEQLSIQEGNSNSAPTLPPLRPSKKLQSKDSAKNQTSSTTSKHVFLRLPTIDPDSSSKSNEHPPSPDEGMLFCLAQCFCWKSRTITKKPEPMEISCSLPFTC